MTNGSDWPQWTPEPRRVAEKPRPSTAAVVIWLLLFLPVGLVLLWKRKDLTQQTRWLVTAGVAVLVIIGAAIGGNSTKTQTLQNASSGDLPTTPTVTASAPATTGSVPDATTPAAVAPPPAPHTSAPQTTAPPPPPQTEQPVQQVTTAPAYVPPPAPKPSPSYKPSPPPPPPSTCGAPSNPFGYNFCAGAYITSPDPSVCDYFNCIASFWKGHGYMEECQDGTYSMSGGIQGACSYHDGELRPVYA